MSPALTGFIQGFLPPLVIAIFLALLPALLKYLSRLQGLPSKVRVGCGIQCFGAPFKRQHMSKTNRRSAKTRPC